jgi:hypothetical protein
MLLMVHVHDAISGAPFPPQGWQVQPYQKQKMFLQISPFIPH